MPQKKIVYLGNVGGPNSASAIHVHNRSELLKNLGYEVHAICDTPKNKEKLKSNDIIKYHYMEPIEGKMCIRDRSNMSITTEAEWQCGQV